MRSIVLGPVVASLCLAASMAQAAGFTLSSPDIKPNATIADAQVYNSFGCSGGEHLAGAEMERRAGGHEEFRADALRPRRADRLGLVALGRLRPAGVDQRTAGRCRRRRRQGAAGRRDAGPQRLRHAGLRRPCPPAGDKPHRYIFTLYALKTDKLDVPADASAALIGFMIQANKLGSATLTGRYGRK